MTIRSRAPLRLGMAGGGTDVSPYSDMYGGAVLNATINMYAYCTLIPTSDNTVCFEATDRKERFSAEAKSEYEIDDILPLHKGVYNRIVKEFNNNEPLPICVSTYSEAPAGSGLGTSSTMVVAILKAYVEYLKLPLGEYEIAQLAYTIERMDIGFSGGKQDQYAATFGGFNFMEFNGENVLVNPLRVKKWFMNELESSIVLYFTGTSRVSAKIIDEQIKSAKNGEKKSIEAMHELKKQAYEMKRALLIGDIDGMCRIINESWKSKKQVSKVISNEYLDNCYDYIMANGGKAAKISGAGGGGFIMILCDPKERKNLIDKLQVLGGNTYTINFDLDGTKGWYV